MSEVCKMTHIMRGSSYAITLFLTFGFVIATITRDVQSAMSFNVYVQFSSMRSTDFYVTSPMMIMFLLLLSLITALCSVASGFFQFKHPQDKRWATLFLVALVGHAIVLHLMSYYAVYNTSKLDLSYVRSWWVSVYYGRCNYNGRYDFNSWSDSSGAFLTLTILAYLSTMVSATLAFLHVTTLEGPSIKEILHLELTGLLNSKAIARLPLPRLLGGTMIPVRQQGALHYVEIKPTQRTYQSLVETIAAEFKIPASGITQILRDGDVLISNDAQVAGLNNNTKLEFVLTPASSSSSSSSSSSTATQPISTVSPYSTEPLPSVTTYTTDTPSFMIDDDE